MDNEQVLAEALVAYNSDDVDGVVANATDDVTYVMGASGIRVTGRDQWKSVVAGVAMACPGRRLRVVRQSVSGDSAGLEWILEGVSSGKVPGFPPAGETVRREGCSMIGFRDGQISSWRDYLDDPGG